MQEAESRAERARRRLANFKVLPGRPVRASGSIAGIQTKSKFKNTTNEPTKSLKTKEGDFHTNQIIENGRVILFTNQMLENRLFIVRQERNQDRCAGYFGSGSRRAGASARIANEDAKFKTIRTNRST